MTTTIVPSLGNSPLMLQAGTGATPGYQAIDMRRMASDYELGEGVSTYGSFLVTQRGAGANMSVDCSMDEAAYIRGDAVSLQGLYPCPPHSATINETVTAADATNPRIDQVVLEVLDNTHDASGSNLVRTRVVAGTPTGGATLDNRTGAAATPASALLLADILVPALSTSVTNANIRDRRAWQAGVPPVLTDVDMAVLIAPWLTMSALNFFGPSMDLLQSAALVRLDRRIAGATRIRWKYAQDGTTAITGNYIFALYDASGRRIVDTGSVAFTGALGTYQVRSETITATTFEPGLYYLLFGIDTTAGGTSSAFTGWPVTLSTNAPAYAPNLALRSAGFGVIAPTTLLSMTDVGGITGATTSLPVPAVALSVG